MLVHKPRVSMPKPAMSNLQEDLNLFRSLVRAMNVVQKEGTNKQGCAQSSSTKYPPVFTSGIKRRRSEVDLQQEMEDQPSDMDDDEDEEEEDDDDEDNKSEDDEDDELLDENDEEEYDNDEEFDELLDFDDDSSSFSSESDTLYDYYSDDNEPPELPFSPPPSTLSPNPTTKTQSNHQPPPLPTPSTSSSPLPNPHPDPKSNSDHPPTQTPTQQPPATEQKSTSTSHPPSPSSSLRCYDHDCGGRLFTTRSNLRRHIREKSRATRQECRCPRCDAVFSRTTARNTHVARGSCERIRRYSNGRVRKSVRVGVGDE